MYYAKYKKQNGLNEGAIMQNNGQYVATTATKGKWFKTLKGAENFMIKEGYIKQN